MRALKRFLSWLFSPAPTDVPDVSSHASARPVKVVYRGAPPDEALIEEIIRTGPYTSSVGVAIRWAIREYLKRREGK